MSRPHDGQRTLFPFGNPFRSILPKGSNLSPKLWGLLTSFEEVLASSMKSLKPEDISDVLSLSWMGHAIECLSEAHTNIKTLITDLQFPVSDWDEKWMDIYLDSSVKLLDICIALSSELSRLDQGHLSLQYVLHVLDFSNNSPSSEQLKRAHASLHDWMKQIDSRSPRLQNCSTILQSLAASLSLTKVKNSAKGKVLLRALYGVKVMTILICSFLMAALSGSSRLLMELHVTENVLWSEAFKDLQAAISEEARRHFSSGKVTAVKELEEIETYVKRLRVLTCYVGCKEEAVRQSNGISHDAEVKVMEIDTNHEEQNLLECVSGMSGSAERLGHGLDDLSKQVGDFFQIVLTGRDALLCNLRVCDASNMDENR
ncbi:UPF0496 protein 4-like [Typha latifolia]|uniref:UPF0496 protein 4-like n=1 Tax=Typha latifolia TaxID=4733 RepID=UPI003C2EE3F8